MPERSAYHLLICALGGMVVGALGASPAWGDDSPRPRVSFTNEVMAVLSKAGCNQGACHGSLNGKNGFKLSLRGENPRFDLRTIVRDEQGRRVNRLEPDRSLLLEKSINSVPHGGGKRFAADSLEYATLRRWIAEGYKFDPPETPRLVALGVEPREAYLLDGEKELQIRATATFSDGSRRDVSRWSVYTPSAPIVAVSESGLVSGERFGQTAVVVRYLDRQATVELALVPPRPNFEWHGPAERNYIDQHVFAKLRRLRINPSSPASDAVFVRRAYLDLLGMIPARNEVQDFLADSAPDKRARLVDRLLERPEMADFWALKWSDLLRNEEKALDRKGVQAFHHYLRQSMADNKPLDRLVYELVAARGSTYADPATNFYRANRDPVTRAEAVAQLFLGVRLQCAKCHNHPFDRWTQDNYYEWTSLFARVEYKILKLERSDELDKHQFAGEQVVWMARKGDVLNPRTGRDAEPAVLDERSAGRGPGPAAGEDRLEYLAAWLTSASNRQFARMQANRVWYQLLGRGIVDPIDDFRATNPPSNGPLLEALTDDLVASGFDLRHLLRTIMNSQVYALSCEPNETNLDDEANFSRGLVRPLSAEQLLDALHRVTGVSTHFSGYPRGLRAVELPGVVSPGRRERQNPDSELLEKFGKPRRLLTCECERSDVATLSQAFQLISGPAINELLEKEDNRIDKWLAEKKSPERIVDDLFWRALGRAPTADEAKQLVKYVRAAKDRRAALEDVLWATLNSKEFLLRP